MTANARSGGDGGPGRGRRTARAALKIVRYAPAYVLPGRCWTNESTGPELADESSGASRRMTTTRECVRRLWL